ncbi:hypothetical protein PRIC1_010997 [Phytophthora ramorum]
MHAPRSSQQNSDAKVVEVGNTPDVSAATSKQVSVVELFSFADSADKLLVLLGTAVPVSCDQCWSLHHQRVRRERDAGPHLYVNAILTKEIGWFDVNDPMQLSSRVTEATITIQDDMGAKMSDLLQFTATIISGIAIAMAKGRQLTLVLMTVVMWAA